MSERGRAKTTSLHITHFMKPDEAFPNCYGAKNAWEWMNELQKSLLKKKGVQAVIDKTEDGMIALRYKKNNEEVCA